jgi:hypothetical protein
MVNTEISNLTFNLLRFLLARHCEPWCRVGGNHPPYRDQGRSNLSQDLFTEKEEEIASSGFALLAMTMGCKKV